MKLCVLFLCSCLLVSAGTLRWTAASAGKGEGLSLVEGPDAQYRLEKTGAEAVAKAIPVNDWYRRAAFLIRVDQPVTGNVWLSVSYLDQGYSLLEISLGGEGRKTGLVRDQWGIARLNTGKFRTAWFKIENPDFRRQIKPGADIQLRGIEQIRSLTLSASEPPREPLPQVEPAVRLQRPVDLVMAAGADARALDGLPGALNALRNTLPLVKALGFNGVESYVKWNFVERSPGVYDWSFYDAVVAEMERHGLRWFPLLIVGSAYALPEWIHASKELDGYVCLEHGVEIEIPTIFNDKQVKYVRRFLSEFGKHYGNRTALLGVRLGPSANYGEAQYPATGAWGYRWGQIHTHIGYWAGDPGASVAFRGWTRTKYGSVEGLNAAWHTRYSSLDQVKTFLPETAQSPRMRVDFSTWYMDAMSDWCEKWAVWAREALPAASIYQSSGGWGAVPIGTDYTAQAKSMAKLKGGIRLTNEIDGYANNFATTRMASSAARFYGARLGYEPAGYTSARGAMARVYNTLANGADHLFFYYGNLLGNDQATSLWTKYAPLLDQGAKPVSDIAVFYPDTAIKLSDEVIRYRLSSPFFDRVQALRAVTDFEYASEQMILDGALDRCKVLVVLWGSVAEQSVIEKTDRWVRAGGILIYAEQQQWQRALLGTIEGDTSLARAWKEGDTGKGRVEFFAGHSEPVKHYIAFIGDTLRALPALHPAIQRGLRIQSSTEVYWTALSNGTIALLNFDDRPGVVRVDGKTVRLAPYTIAIE